jgi:hypothetical protein
LQQASSENVRASCTQARIMTIMIHFHQSHYRTFKAYDTEYVQVHLSSEFPCLVSYQRFVALIPSVQIPLLAYLQIRYGHGTSISFIDSTSNEVCDPKRISQHRVFATDATRGKTRMGSGFTVSSCIWPSTILGNCWLVV